MNCLLSLCLLASAISAVVASTSQPVPVLAHSNQPTFLHASSSNVMHADDFSALVHDIISPRQSSLVSATTPAPEVLVTVVYDKLDFATLAREMGAYGRESASPLSQIKPAMSSSTSSLTIPYAYPSASYRTTTASILSTVASVTPRASRIVMGGADTTALKTDITRVQSCTSLLSHLTSHPALFNNGVTDVIVLSVTPSDTCVAELLTFLASQQTTHVVMYTAEQSSHDIHMTFNQVHGVSPVTAYQVKADTTTGLRHNLHFTTGPTRLTPNILIGILVMIFLLFMLYLGVNCLMAIERPVRMSSTVLQISKEY